MNLEQLRSRVRRLSGVRLEELLPTSDLDALLNEAYRELMGLRQWPFLRRDVQVASGVPVEPEGPVGPEEPEEGEEPEPVELHDFSLVTLPFTSRHIEGVALRAGKRLRQVTIHDLDTLPEREDEPELYARKRENELRLWPAPQSSVTLLVRAQELPSSLVGENDVPAFEEEFHPSLAYMVAARVLAEEGDDSGRAQMYADEASAFIARMEDRYLASQDAGVFVMGGGSQRRRLF